MQILGIEKNALLEISVSVHKLKIAVVESVVVKTA